MTPEQLRAAGRALYGDDLEDGLAYALHLAPGTLRRMLAGREPIGEPLRRELDRLLTAGGRRRIGPPILTHLVVNTGILLPSPKGQAGPEAVRTLAPMVAAGRGEPAGIPFVVTHRGEGVASFELGRPAAELCTVCWGAERSAEAWPRVLGTVPAETTRRAPAGPPPVPWLAVLTLPPLHALPVDTVLRLADLERCLAWALIGSG
jgi:hypothetical protein